MSFTCVWKDQCEDMPQKQQKARKMQLPASMAQQA